MSVEWRPANTVQQYLEKISRKGIEIEEHLKRKHNGIPQSSCHRCVTLRSSLSDLKEA